MRLPRMTTRRWMIAVAIAAVFLAFASEALRSWMWYYRDRQAWAGLTISKEILIIKYVLEHHGRTAEATKVSAKAQRYRVYAAAHAAARSRYRPPGWSGDLFLRIFRLPLLEKIGLLLAAGVALVGVGAVLWPRALRGERSFPRRMAGHVTDDR